MLPRRSVSGPSHAAAAVQGHSRLSRATTTAHKCVNGLSVRLQPHGCTAPISRCRSRAPAACLRRFAAAQVHRRRPCTSCRCPNATAGWAQHSEVHRRRPLDAAQQRGGTAAGTFLRCGPQQRRSQPSANQRPASRDRACAGAQAAHVRVGRVAGGLAQLPRTQHQAHGRPLRLGRARVHIAATKHQRFCQR